VAVKHHSVNRLVWGHALAVIAEWAVVVGVLVHAYQWGGEWAVGAASVGMVLPAFVVAPLAASLTVRRHPAARRRSGSKRSATARLRPQRPSELRRHGWQGLRSSGSAQ
jgi:hypothetical protein